MNLRSVCELTNLRGKRVLLRAELNIPLEHGRIRDAYRLEQALPTINYLVEAGARVVLMAHIGRELEETLWPVFEALVSRVPAVWAGGVVGPVVKARANALQPGQVLVLENLRQDPREAANDPAFARALADLADVYVNDAFANMHRDHASMLGVTDYLPAYAGMNVMAEVNAIQTVLTPQTPALFIVGGAKFETKQPLVEKFLDAYDHLYVGGALANDFFKARGYDVGKSVVGEAAVTAALCQHPKLLLPVDVIVENDRGDRRLTTPDAVHSDESILDAGPETLALLAPLVAAAATILWNGPIGYYEGGHTDGTEGLAKLIAASAAHSVVGGGDTVASIQRLGLNDQFGFVSTGGGAMLTLLEAGMTPALQKLLR